MICRLCDKKITKKQSEKNYGSCPKCRKQELEIGKGLKKILDQR